LIPELEIKQLQVELFNEEGSSMGSILRGMDLELFPGEKLALVGESGSGKSVTALSVMNLLPSRKMRRTRGSILFKGIELTKIAEEDWREIRGKQISIIFQDPLAALNPLLTVGQQVRESLASVPRNSSHKQNLEVIRLFAEMGLPDPERIYGSYPHQLSGGMCQRVCIAIALAASPSLLIADEPTTALDVTVQIQILNLLNKEAENRKFTLLFITHNIRLMERFSDRLAVVYGGQLVEVGKTSEIFKKPRHPYTESLLSSLEWNKSEITFSRDLLGLAPKPTENVSGCVYFKACPRSKTECFEKSPEFIKKELGKGYRCFYPS
jgi:oligopeptide/dipeptide ABC transporter ATP-binding protein